MSTRGLRKLKTELRRLLARQKVNDFEVAELLFEIREASGYEFRIHVRDVDMDLGKATRMVAVHQLIRRGVVSKERALRIGWRKLNIVRTRLGKSEDEKWLGYAEFHPERVVQRTIQELTGAKRCIKLRGLTSEDVARIDALCLQYGALRNGRGIQDRAAAIMAMVAVIEAQQRGVKPRVRVSAISQPVGQLN